MNKIPLLEKIVFEFINIASDATVLYGVYSLSQGNKDGLFYTIMGICGEGISVAHALGRKYSLSDMLNYSRLKYSLLNKITEKIR